MQALQDSPPDTGRRPSQERRISRFKVSVVNEPDRSKLVPPISMEPQPTISEQLVKRESESASSGDISNIAAAIPPNPMTGQSSEVQAVGAPQPVPIQMVQAQISGPFRGGATGVSGPPGHGQDFTTVINTTFDSLKTTLVKSLPNTGGERATLLQYVL